MQFYPHGADIIEFADQLLALPNTIVLDHFASVTAEGGVDQPAFKTLLRMLDTGRVWIKLSGPMRCTRRTFPIRRVTPMARALVAHRPDRLVFGHRLAACEHGRPRRAERRRPGRPDPEWIEDAATQQQILVDNPRSFTGFRRRSDARQKSPRRTCIIVSPRQILFTVARTRHATPTWLTTRKCYD